MESNLSLENQTLLVTGVSRSLGIGTAITELCAKAKGHVIIHGNSNYDKDRAYPDATTDFVFSLEKELRAKGYQVTALPPSDLSKSDEPEKIIKAATKVTGSLDGLILNHAYSVHAPIFEWTSEHIDNHFSINVRASMLMIQAFAQQIDKEKGGAITLFTSGQYLGPMIDEIAYALSKEAIRGMCQQVATALAPHNIRVNCVNPGPTDTGYLTGELYDQVADMFPSGRWGMPKDAARLVHFLHSDYARWITGQTIASEGGFQR
ncbi:SDR family oxidoreductase [Aureispira anguillae]|uniref:SDR family oxidoreductase n=1 Tax=Aureispira anguillae TaxID=2864201 RepID=A0A915YED8_9BACT|nr:SDR family oxidoreductase [Aureispira anguillae]BDS11588.1 SDR family oxidoreductase [Aureispira anguillae]